MSKMLKSVCGNEELAEECEKLKDEIDSGIKKFGIVKHEKYGKIYACETDGMGHYSMIDDANIPSLLSIPFPTKSESIIPPTDPAKIAKPLS